MTSLKCRLSMTASAFLLLLGGCATAEKTQSVERFWPEPPLTPRIRFVGVLRSQEDFRGAQTRLLTDALFGQLASESLSQPMGVVLSRDGKRLYVTNYAEPDVFVFDLERRRLSPLRGDAYAFESPLGIAVDDKDNVYVVDSLPRRILVFDSSGAFLRAITDQRLERPTGIAVDSARRRIYVADSARLNSANHTVRIFDLEGRYLDAIGGRGGEEGRFFFPTYLAVDADGNLYVADTMNGRVQVFAPSGRHLRTLGGRGDAVGMFDKPKGVALDSFGNVYVVDSAWSNVQIFNRRGEVLLFFGARGRSAGFLFNPTGIAIDKDNRIYVADAFNGRISIFQLINTTTEDSIRPAPGQAQLGLATRRGEDQ